MNLLEWDLEEHKDLFDKTRPEDSLFVHRQQAPFSALFFECQR